jgi:6-phosphogluconolactonase (cycloisomerase 2 family)
MKSVLGLVTLAALAMLGCMVTIKNDPSSDPTSNNPPGCFTPQPGEVYLDRNAVFVANTGSSSISAFQSFGSTAAGLVCGSPFPVSAPPTALGGGYGEIGQLVVLSAPQKTISLFTVDVLTSVLTGPVATLSTPYTPMAVTAWGNYLYVANAEGNVSVYQVSSGNAAAEIPGSPFPAGSGPVGIATADAGLLFVANSQSNNISGYSLGSNGVPTPLPGSPFPAGRNPSSIVVAPPMYTNGLGTATPTLVFVTNAASNNVSVYMVSGDGTLVPVPGSPFAAGAGPSSSAIGYGLSFLYVANSKSNDISAYSIDNSTGVLTPLAGFPFAVGPSPSSLASSGAFLYVTSAGSNTLWVLQPDASSGALTPVSGSPFPVGQSPGAVLYFQVPQ